MAEREAYDGSDSSDYDKLLQQIEQIKLRAHRVGPSAEAMPQYSTVNLFYQT
jgi:hypothetical protein